MTTNRASDVLIIGAGVIGLSIARALNKRGVRNISVIERGAAGAEASHAAAGMLAPQCEADRPDDFFRLCRGSNRFYPLLSQQLKVETGADIELDQCGTFFAAFTDEDAAEIGERFEWQKRSGLAVEHLTAEDALKEEPNLSPTVREALYFPYDTQVENRKLVAALKKYAEINGITVRQYTEIKELIVDNDHVAGAISASEKFYAGMTILAAGAWTPFIKFREGVVPVEVKPVRGQIICFEPRRPLFRKVIYTPRGYIVPRADGRLLVGATVEDKGFDKMVTAEGTEKLRRNAEQISPAFSGLEISDSWVGLRPASPDGLPVLGELPDIKGLIVATGHYRNGILLAPITAEIVADYVAKGIRSEFFDIFGPQRLRAATTV
ncbi:MAG TPA: glycine oxidase ThiO [Pyrinomonadaceae bacterium]|nr:glycine oxidase ThiO [Pyrinomonadaceae bacterium]